VTSWPRRPVEVVVNSLSSSLNSIAYLLPWQKNQIINWLYSEDWPTEAGELRGHKVRWRPLPLQNRLLMDNVSDWSWGYNQISYKIEIFPQRTKQKPKMMSSYVILNTLFVEAATGYMQHLHWPPSKIKDGTMWYNKLFVEVLANDLFLSIKARFSLNFKGDKHSTFQIKRFESIRYGAYWFPSMKLIHFENRRMTETEMATSRLSIYFAYDGRITVTIWMNQTNLCIEDYTARYDTWSHLCVVPAIKKL